MKSYIAPFALAVVCMGSLMLAGTALPEDLGGWLDPVDSGAVAPTEYTVVLPEGCETVLSSTKNRTGLYVTYKTLHGDDHMVQFEYLRGAYRATHTYRLVKEN